GTRTRRPTSSGAACTPASARRSSSSSAARSASSSAARTSCARSERIRAPCERRSYRSRRAAGPGGPAGLQNRPGRVAHGWVGSSAGVPAKPAGAYVSPTLLAQAAANPDQVFDVIVQGSPKHGATVVANDVRADAAADHAVGVGLKRELATIDGAAAALTGKQ